MLNCLLTTLSKLWVEPSHILVEVHYLIAWADHFRGSSRHAGALRGFNARTTVGWLSSSNNRRGTKGSHEASRSMAGCSICRAARDRLASGGRRWLLDAAGRTGI